MGRGQLVLAAVVEKFHFFHLSVVLIPGVRRLPTAMLELVFLRLLLQEGLGHPSAESSGILLLGFGAGQPLRPLDLLELNAATPCLLIDQKVSLVQIRELVFESLALFKQIVDNLVKPLVLGIQLTLLLHHVIHLAHGLLRIVLPMFVLLLAVFDPLFELIAVDLEVFLHALLLLLQCLPSFVGFLDLLRQARLAGEDLVILGDLSVLLLQDSPDVEFPIADLANVAFAGLHALDHLRE